MNDERKIPAGRLGRLARMAAVGARTGASLLLDKTGEGAAEHAAEVLGTLRGLAAKLGQMASYVDGIVPEQHREAYETSMKKLRAQAPKSSSAQIRALVEGELGAPIDQLFASWEDAPLASASIGQVHRATLPGGDDVAVKVQHPGIAQAVESDLANAGILEGFAGLAMGKRVDAKAMLAVARQRFREELDYLLEAERTSIFSRTHAGDPFIVIPKVHASHTTHRVLTTSFADGMGFDDACRASEEERQRWARAMWRFVFKGTLIAGQLNADPHPGNYVFHPGGKVTFLDYGCIQPFGDRKDGAIRGHRAAIRRDEKEFAESIKVMIASVPGALEDKAVAYTRRCFQPLFGSPFRMTKGFAASLVDEMKDLALLARKTKDKEFFTMPADMLFVNRLQFGFYSVLARLDVEVDYAEVERGFIPGMS